MTHFFTFQQIGYGEFRMRGFVCKNYNIFTVMLFKELYCVAKGVWDEKENCMIITSSLTDVLNNIFEVYGNKIGVSYF